MNQSNPYRIPDTRCSKRPCHPDGYSAVVDMFLDEPYLWMYIHRAFQANGKHVSCVQMGRGIPCLLKDFSFLDILKTSIQETRKTKTSIWWNVWVLLATPAIWLAW